MIPAPLWEGPLFASPKFSFSFLLLSLFQFFSLSIFKCFKPVCFKSAVLLSFSIGWYPAGSSKFFLDRWSWWNPYNIRRDGVRSHGLISLLRCFYELYFPHFVLFKNFCYTRLRKWQVILPVFVNYLPSRNAWISNHMLLYIPENQESVNTWTWAWGFSGLVSSQILLEAACFLFLRGSLFWAALFEVEPLTNFHGIESARLGHLAWHTLHLNCFGVGVFVSCLWFQWWPAQITFEFPLLLCPFCPGTQPNWTSFDSSLPLNAGCFHPWNPKSHVKGEPGTKLSSSFGFCLWHPTIYHIIFVMLVCVSLGMLVLFWCSWYGFGV